MKKMNLVILLCVLVTCLAGCAKEKASTVVQDTGEKESKVIETNSVVNVKDILQTMNSLQNETGKPQPMEAMVKDGYKRDELLKVKGVLTIDNVDLLVSHNTAILASEISPKSSMSDQIFFVCGNEKNEHVLIPSGTEVTVEGTLSMDEYSVYLSNCKFITPDIQNPEYQENVSSVLESHKDTEQIIQGTVKEVIPIELTDSEREELSWGFVDENDTYLVSAMLGASHKVILTDGVKDIEIYISQNNNENIQAGERIAVKGIVREEEKNFVRAGDSAYFFDR